MPADLLGIYLNDHLMGATGGLELFRRAARNQRDRPWGPALGRLTLDVAQCRVELVEIMAALGIPRRRYKVIGAWLGEKAGRAKLNGRLVGHSPLSDLVELELMKLGLEGQGAMWRSLLATQATEPRLDRGQLESLLARATSFAAELEGHRLAAAEQALS